MEEQRTSVNIFCCYAHQDKALHDELNAHLSLLRRSGRMNIWSDKEISPGAEWEKEIAEHLNKAHIILLLISADFIASSYCYDHEMKRALERHIRGEARVIPILLRSVDFEEAPFSTLEMLPTKAKPIVQWSDKDEAMTNVARGIRQVVMEIAIERLQVTNRQASIELGLAPPSAAQDNIRLLPPQRRTGGKLNIGPPQPRTGGKLNIGPPQPRTTNEEIHTSGLTPGRPPASGGLTPGRPPASGGPSAELEPNPPPLGLGPSAGLIPVTETPLPDTPNLRGNPVPAQVRNRPSPVEPQVRNRPSFEEEDIMISRETGQPIQYGIPQPLEPDETVSFLQSLFQIFSRHRQVRQDLTGPTPQPRQGLTGPTPQPRQGLTGPTPQPRQGLTGPTPQPQSSDGAIYPSKTDGQLGVPLANRPVINPDGKPGHPLANRPVNDLDGSSTTGEMGNAAQSATQPSSSLQANFLISPAVAINTSDPPLILKKPTLQQITDALLSDNNPYASWGNLAMDGRSTKLFTKDAQASNPLSKRTNSIVPVGGACTLGKKGFGTVHALLSSEKSFSDFAFQVQMTLLKEMADPCNVGGVTFRVNPVQNQYYFFSTCQEKSSSPGRWNTSWSLDLIDGKNTLSLAKGAILLANMFTPILIGIVVQGYLYDIYIDLHHLRRIEERYLTEGTLGIIAGHFKYCADAKVLFDHAKLWTP